MLFRLALAAILTILSTISFAEDAKIHTRVDGIVQYPVCVVNGIRVHYQKGSPQFLRRNNAQTAVAIYDPKTKTPAVFYNHDYLSKQTPTFQSWVFAHECAHWELGHLARPYMAGAREYEEEQADCRGAGRLVEADWSLSQLNTLLDEIKDQQDNAFRFVNERMMPGVRKPLSGDHRKAHARQCMEEAINRRSADLY